MWSNDIISRPGKKSQNPGSAGIVGVSKEIGSIGSKNVIIVYPKIKVELNFWIGDYCPFAEK